MGRIGEFDVSQPVRRDGDRGERRVERTTLASGDDVLHLRDRDVAIGQMEVFGDAPPKVPLAPENNPSASTDPYGGTS